MFSLESKRNRLARCKFPKKMFRRPQVGGELAGQEFAELRLLSLLSLTTGGVQHRCNLVCCVIRIMMIRIADDMKHCRSRRTHWL
jgi:hypothetical protein